MGITAENLAEKYNITREVSFISLSLSYRYSDTFANMCTLYISSTIVRPHTSLTNNLWLYKGM